jgi:hypothetical protein
MRKRLSWFEVAAAVVGLFGSIAVLSFALIAWFDGYDWQALAFGAGGLYVGVWSTAQLSSVAPER